MLRAALACCALLACKGSPPEDHRAPAQAPVAPAPADAAVPDAPATPCFAIPFTADGEHAGIRRLAHHVPPPTTGKAPTVRDVLKLVVGKQTVIPRLQPSPLDTRYGQQPPRPRVRVPAVANAQGLLVMPDTFTDKVTVNAPAFLEGAVIEIAGEGFATVAIGDAGLATLARYREHYVKPRLAATPVEGDERVSVSPLVLMLDDLDGDGVLELVSFSRVGFRPKVVVKGKPIRGSDLELGVLWSTGELAYVRVSTDAFDAPTHYVVPPTLSGGKVLLLSMAGDRVALEGKTLTKLPAVVMAGDKRCLHTSPVEPATVLAAP